jgi:hypothetical protein
MRKLVWIAAALLASSCTHVIKNVSDCKQLDGLKRVECSTCLVQNEAEGWLGTYEYRPDASAPGDRCKKVK